MRTLPLAARLYLALVVALATLLGLAALPLAGRLFSKPLIALAAMVGLLLAYRAEVSFENKTGHRILFAADDAITIFCVSALGPPGIWVVAVALTISQLLQRKPWERLLFNVAMLSVTYTVASTVYTQLQPAAAIPFGGITGLITFVAVAASYYGSNALLVSFMVALATARPMLEIYRGSMLQASWVHLLTYTIGATMAALYAIDPWLLTYSVVTLVVARYAFATVVALNAETRQRQELAEQQAALYEEQARLNHELAEQQAELARASKLATLGTFSAGIAHEFNNVLTAVLGHAQVGQLSDSFAEKDYSLDVIARVCQRATSITNSLLTFARQREPELALGRLQTALDETLALVRPDLLKNQIALHQEIGDLPPILCDLGQLNQVLLNLITNARDALRERPGGEIRLALAQEGAHAVITIADNGPGMAPEVLDKLFQPFVTTKKKGNGLGMAICYGIIETHKGKIDVASTLGQGTTITIRLPIGPVDLLCADEPELAEATT